MTDKELMLGIACGQADALVALRKRYEPLLRTAAKSILSSDEEIKDVVSTVFLSLWAKPKAYDPEKGEPLGWLITVTRRRALDTLRALRSRAHTLDDFVRQPHEAFNLPVQAESKLKLGLKALPREQQAAILSFALGETRREGAKRLGIPCGTFQTRLTLGLAKLKRIYGNYR